MLLYPHHNFLYISLIPLRLKLGILKVLNLVVIAYQVFDVPVVGLKRFAKALRPIIVESFKDGHGLVLCCR